MGKLFKTQTMLICSGVHQIEFNDVKTLDDLVQNFGFDVDYAMECLKC